MAFYAVVCGLLAGVAPILESRLARILFGAAIGVVAALSLPHVRAAIGI